MRRADCRFYKKSSNSKKDAPRCTYVETEEEGLTQFELRRVMFVAEIGTTSRMQCKSSALLWIVIVKKS